MTNDYPERGHILIVEDDEKISEMLSRYLTKNGFSVSIANDLSSARNSLRAIFPNIVLLDVILRGQDGLSLLKEFRATSGTGFIIVSGRKTIFDRVVGLELGADDYITKPFSLREVMARINAVLRRRLDTEKQNQKLIDRVAIFAGWTFNIDCRQLIDPCGNEVPLTTGEYKLLQQFVMRPGRALNRDQLMDLTRERDRNPFDRTIDAQVSRLRRKIETDSRKPQLVKSVHGTGYVFTCKVDWVKTTSASPFCVERSSQIEFAA